MNNINETAEADVIAREEDRARRAQDRINEVKRAKAMFNPFAIPSLGRTEFPAVELGRRESKCSRAFAVVVSCR